MPAPATFLLLEDDPSDALLVRRALGRMPQPPARLEVVSTLAEAKRLLGEGGFEVVLTDLHVIDSSGLDTCRALCAAAPETAVVVLTGSDRDVGVEAIEAGAQDFLIKGAFALGDLARVVSQARARARLLGEVRAARVAAELASRSKSTFLASMSHELRTPLNAVLGFAEVLEDQTSGPINAKQARQVGNILASGRHLLGMINDLLDLARVEAGQLALIPTSLDLGHLLGEAVDLARAPAREKSLAWEVAIAPGLPAMAGDPRRLRQVLWHLLSNAVKFCPEHGSIAVALDAVTEGARQQLRLRVSDTGIGLDQQDLERIFDDFAQVDGSLARRQQGAGLGLSLARRLVELHGGRIWADSGGTGRGATFTVLLPCAATPGDTA